MTPEDGRPDPARDADAAGWLDGLAGRGGAGESAQEGTRLRAALKPGVDEQAAFPAPPWQHIATAARQPVAGVPAQERPAAANQGQWRRFAAGGVAVFALLVGAGLWNAGTRQDPASGGMRGTAAPAGAQWRTENPAQAASDLTQRLEAAGARVTTRNMGAGRVLSVVCEASLCAGVNAQLAPLETAVDSTGRLDLQVLPLN